VAAVKARAPCLDRIPVYAFRGYALQGHVIAVQVAHFLEVLEKFMGGRRSHHGDNPDLRLRAGVYRP
jgi:hypothetical protein